MGYDVSLIDGHIDEPKKTDDIIEDPAVIAQKTIEALSGFQQYKNSELMKEYNIIQNRYKMEGNKIECYKKINEEVLYE